MCVKLPGEWNLFDSGSIDWCGREHETWMLVSLFYSDPFPLFTTFPRNRNSTFRRFSNGSLASEKVIFSWSRNTLAPEWRAGGGIRNIKFKNKMSWASNGIKIFIFADLYSLKAFSNLSQYVPSGNRINYEYQCNFYRHDSRPSIDASI